MRPLLLPLLIAAALALAALMPSVAPEQETSDADRLLAAIGRNHPNGNQQHTDTGD